MQKDLQEVSPIFSCRDPYLLAGSWSDFVGDLTVYHSAWAEYYKVKKGKTVQDLVVLAYHLAHSGTLFFFFCEYISIILKSS